MILALTAASACLFAEFAGYWLHILLHSERIGFLSRSHMIHHLVVYPPNKPMRPSRQYLDSTFGRASLLGLGMAWILPAAILIAVLLASFRAGGVRPLHQAIFIGTSLAWGFATFYYMHDAMHLQDFWMETHPLLHGWFLRARKRHDIHHMRVAADGRMMTNFGICFALFDRVFGSFAPEHDRFNQAGFEAAMRRYSHLLPRGPQDPASV
jgi:sterol desaturase/sphingolipid hydroxylase (fatty acid hydroxylase superfamily)